MKKKDIALGFLAAFFLAVFFSPLASRSPDGLERTAQDQGFSEKEIRHKAFVSVFPDYDWAWAGADISTRSVAAAAGVILTGALGWALAWFLRKRRQRASADYPSENGPPESSTLPFK